MPRDGSGVWSAPPGTTANPNTTILSAAYNALVADLTTDLNAARPITAGGTGGTSVITGWDGLAAKGTDIATASSINLTTATGPSLTLTGTTTITSVTLAEGSIRVVRAAGSFQITASASLLCNGSAVTNLSVVAEDLLIFRGGASSVVSVARIGAASVSAATTSAAGIVELANLAETLAGTDTSRAVVPANLYQSSGHISADFRLSTNSGDATNDIDITAHVARDSTDSYNIVQSALTKQLDVAWALGSAAGMLATGASVTNTTYYLFDIKRNDTGVVDFAADTSSTGANIAANTNAAYTIIRRVGHVVRTGGVNGVPVMYAQPTVEMGGGAAPVFACRAWVNFNGTGTVAIRASGNVSSITDNGTGDYTVNFTTAMPDANYCPVVGVTIRSGADANSMPRPYSGGTAATTTSYRIYNNEVSATRLAQDAEIFTLAFLR